LGLVGTAHAATSAASAAAQGEAASESGANRDNEPGASPWVPGPTRVSLGHDLTLDLPSSDAFLPAAEAAKVLEKMGNLHNQGLLGLATDRNLEANWFVVIRYDEEGHVADDEAIDADELLDSLREGTEASNDEREKLGFRRLVLDGWSEPPRYDRVGHRLIWGLLVSDVEGKSVNYNTRVLGRRGVVSLNLVTDPDKLSQDQPRVKDLLAGTSFAEGARYQDFDPSTDKVAEYGLTGLVMAGAGLGAAKLLKVGLLAKFWNVLLVGILAGKKVLLLGLVAALAWLKKAFFNKREEPAAPPPDDEGQVR